MLSAEDGRAAVDLYRSHRDEIGLVVLDMIMPEMDGRDALVGIRTIDADARVLVATGFMAANGDEDLVSLGAIGVLPKPFTGRELLARVGAALGGTRSGVSGGMNSCENP